MKKLLFLFFSFLFVTHAFAQLDVVRVTVEDGVSDGTIKQNIESNATALLSLFNSTIITGKTKLRFKEDICTESGMEYINEMWSSSAMMCPVSSFSDKCMTISSGYQMRNIPITVLAADDDKQEQELVINFSVDGKIDNVLIALDQNRYMDIINSKISVTDLVRRQAIIDFVENYRTAYNRKDIDFIDKVFSNNALIITGKVIKVKNDDLAMKSLSKEEIKYQTSTKAEYISNLKKCFSKASYINVQFDEIEVIRHPLHDQVFGVTLKQHWNASNYSDVGYVFLMIDFSDDLNPVIDVRTWQPEKYNGTKIDRNEVFSLSNFDIGQF